LTAIRQVGRLDPSFGWDSERLYSEADFRAGKLPSQLRGSAGFVGAVNAGSTHHRIIRDPLGINKLFWARGRNGAVALAARPIALVQAGHAFETIQAIPRGSVIELEGGSVLIEHSLVPRSWSDPPVETSAEGVGSRVRETLDRYLEALVAAYPHARPYVCLSGGLDSSGIAALVVQHFDDAVAVSFDIQRSVGASDDRRTAARLARELGMPLLEATVSAGALLDPLDTVLTEAIDWRDFNVHAGLVNAALAAAISEAAGSDRDSIVFTGDLANEFLVDYQPEHYGGATHYELPRLAPSALRTSLVRGLDTCHREVGVFAAYGLAVVQPYAVAVDAYLSLGSKFLGIPDRKERLCRAIFAELLPRYVYSRPKARAQVGGAEVEGSVLAICVDRGIDTRYLRKRFAELHAVSDEAELDRFFRAGRYRASAPRSHGRCP
jgi:asparagine synthetase B (glutamine-hydrolysing)